MAILCHTEFLDGDFGVGVDETLMMIITISLTIYAKN